VGDAPTVAVAQPGIRVGGTIGGEGESILALIELIDFEQAIWSPSLTEGSAGPASAGVVLAEKAAADLGVAVGEEVTLRLPVMTGESSFTLESTTLPVSALHPYPLRNFAYMDIAHSGLLGLDGTVNLVQVLPAAGSTTTDVTRSLLTMESVSSVQEVRSVVQSVRDAMGQIIGILTIVGFFVFIVALLIAFNAASISLDERFRDHATMFAFGVPIRTALRMAMTESMVVGLIATTVGIFGGLAMLWWVTSQLLATTLPDFGVAIILRPQTLMITALLGVVAVACAPLFTVRRMRRMDLPGTLRLME
jgi:putative ABC transport system permease protein